MLILGPPALIGIFAMLDILDMFGILDIEEEEGIFIMFIRGFIPCIIPIRLIEFIPIGFMW